MHPIERLRYVARASDAPVESVLAEAAGSLAGFVRDPVSAVTAARRLVQRHPANGPVWSLCARALTALDPADEAWRVLDAVTADPTLNELRHALPDAGRVAVVGWPERLTEALGGRGDCEVRVLDIEGDGPGFVRRLSDVGLDAIDVPITGLAPAVAGADVVVLDASAVGPETALVPPGGWTAAAVARTSDVPVWVVAGSGRVLPAGLWAAMLDHLGPQTVGWNDGPDRLPLTLVDRLVGPKGPEPVAACLDRGDTPDAPELRPGHRT